jgi:hydroxymethylglutaryl-CoA lyase
LVGNIPTEILLAELRRVGALLPAIGPLEMLVEKSRELYTRFGSLAQSRAGETWISERS